MNDFLKNTPILGILTNLIYLQKEISDNHTFSKLLYAQGFFPNQPILNSSRPKYLLKQSNSYIALER